MALKHWLIGAGVAAVTGGAWWVVADTRSSARAEAYSDALALCSRDASAGRAKIDALDRVWGEEARPKQLRLRLSGCSLDGAMEDYRRTLRAVGNQKP